MSKLWSKSATKTENWVEGFTVGRDRDLDEQLAESDILASIAHAQMLAKVNLIEQTESDSLIRELQQMYRRVQSGDFRIEDGVEDVHSQIEMELIEVLGSVGKKIHTGRSRNDQVLVALKIYFRSYMKGVIPKVESLIQILLNQAEKHKAIFLPGYTHLQVAMPSSFGLWFSAYAESLIDDLVHWQAAFRISNRNPLGSGAGYGSSFPLDRDFTTEALGFEGLHQNVVYAQMGRGRTELSLSQAMAITAQTVNRFAMDACLYLSQNFGFIKLPPSYTTGSSIMPHKKNPDVFEIMRGRCNQLMGLPNQMMMLMSNLPSGYHREMQLMKEYLFPAMEDLDAVLDALIAIIPTIEPIDSILNDEKYTYLFTVDAVHEKVRTGLSFRDAYKEVGDEIENGTYSFEPLDASPHTLQGSSGNLGIARLEARLSNEMKLFNWEVIQDAERKLLGEE